MINFLTERNQTYTEQHLIERDEDVHYCVLDYSARAARDFVFPPLVYLDNFRVETINVVIAGVEVRLPRDWSIVVGDRDFGWFEVVEVEIAATRGFEALLYNPLAASMPGFAPIALKGCGEAQAWAAPRLRRGHLLAMPIEQGDQPRCILIVHDASKLVGGGMIDIDALV